MFESHVTYFLACSQVTLITGRVPCPQSLSEMFSQPSYLTQASHSSHVTSNLETAKGFAIVTSCCGPSRARRPVSLSGDPIVKLPAGITIISGQSLAHSRKLASPLSAP